MDRSTINAIIRDGADFIRSFGYVLPPFAEWTLDDWLRRKGDCDEIFRARLGWDVTDYGLGGFDKTGLFLFTARNGRLEHLNMSRGMLYAEKIMISRREQLSPMHFHEVKAEDIINRGGGTVVVELYERSREGALHEERPVTVHCDGIERTVPAGGRVALKPGESITLLPRTWHAFWAEGGDALIGEVSTVNDDETDNYFLEPIGRFPDIDEDEAPFRLMVGDYARFLA